MTRRTEIIEADVSVMSEMLEAILNEVGCGCCAPGGVAVVAAEKHGLEMAEPSTWSAIDALRDKILDLYREALGLLDELALGEASGLQ